MSNTNKKIEVIRSGSASFAFLLLLFAGLSGCGSSDGTGSGGPFDLTVSGTGFGPHDGQTLYLAVFNDDTGQKLDSTSAIVGSGAFSFNWPGVLEEGVTYRLDYFADINGNGECETTDDHEWRATTTVGSSNVDLALVHSTNFTPEACQSFPLSGGSFYDLAFSGSGFEPHEGQTLFVAVVGGSGRVIGTNSAVVTGGTFSFTWSGALEGGEDYKVDFFADINGDGQCAGGQDHVWRLEIPAVSQAVDLIATHNTNFKTDACNSF